MQQDTAIQQALVKRTYIITVRHIIPGDDLKQRK
jgi:hypothetical protein